MQVKIFSFFLLYVLSSFFSTNMYCMYPQPTKNYTEQDAEMLISDLATMNPELAYIVALSTPANLKSVILKSNVKNNFEIFLSSRYSEYFSPPQLVPNISPPAIDLNYVKPFSLNETRKPYGTTKVIFLKDTKNDEFVLKFYYPPTQEEVIHEYVGSYIGLSVGIPINKVEIIPPHTMITDKISTDNNFTTLHTLAPGIMVREQPQLAQVNIQFGLSSIQNLQSIAMHFDLCDIVALDIALNNKDRGQNNYFFDSDNNHYHAIDMGGIFSGIRDNQQHLSIEQEIKRFFPQYIFQKTVSFTSCTFLKTLKAHKLSNKEIEALKRVNSTLKKLSDQFSADTLYSLWMQKAQEIGFHYPENKKAVLKLYIDYNDYYVKKVIEELERLTAIPQTTPEEEKIREEEEELKEQKKIPELKEVASEALTKKLQLQQQIAHVVKEQPRIPQQNIQPLPFVQPIQEIVSPTKVSADEPTPKSISFTPIPESPTKQIKKKLDKEEKKPEKTFYQNITELMENSFVYMKATITSVFNTIWSWLRGK